VRTEVRKALKYKPNIVEYIIVTTADDDRALDQLAQELTKAQRERGRKIRIQVWGWGTLEDHIDQHQEAKEAFDPGASPAVKAVKASLKTIAKNQGRQATAQQFAELSQKIDDQRSSLANEQLPPALADKEVTSEIRIILARRGFPEAKTVTEWAHLADRVLTSDLVKARTPCAVLLDSFQQRCPHAELGRGKENWQLDRGRAVCGLSPCFQ
jgi:hypothetical protein